MFLKQPPDFNSFNLLNIELYATDYQLFIKINYPNGPFYQRYIAHYSRILDIHTVSSWSS